MGSDNLYMQAPDSDHDVSLILSGDVETLRSRLTEAVEKLGYRVISDYPFQAKRGAQGGAKYACSFEPLDYPTKLTIGLKKLNNASVSASFFYEVQSYGWGLSGGDHKTLLRESKAIAALATQKNSLTVCASCGTDVTDDSRFCRRCGSPLTADVAEVEVWQLTKGARASLHDIVAGVSILFLTALLVSVVFYFGGAKAEKIVSIVGIMFGVFGLLALIEGIWQLNGILNPKEEKQITTSQRPRQNEIPLTSLATSNLSPRKPVASITEGTTELLNVDDFREEQIAVPVAGKRIDTSEVEPLN